MATLAPMLAKKNDSLLRCADAKLGVQYFSHLTLVPAHFFLLMFGQTACWFTSVEEVKMAAMILPMTSAVERKPNTVRLLPSEQYDQIIVSFSGGKDSVWLALDMKERLEAAGLPLDRLQRNGGWDQRYHRHPEEVPPGQRQPGRPVVFGEPQDRHGGNCPEQRAGVQAWAVPVPDRRAPRGESGTFQVRTTSSRQVHLTSYSASP
jgi:hypothetical protein